MLAVTVSPGLSAISREMDRFLVISLTDQVTNKQKSTRNQSNISFAVSTPQGNKKQRRRAMLRFIEYSIIAPTLLKPEVWHELIRIVKINWFKWYNVFHKDVDTEAVACVHNLQYRFSTDISLEVVSNGTIQKLGYGFLLAFCSNYGRIFCRFDTVKVKALLDVMERSSCTSNYWDPAFSRLKIHKNAQGPTTTCWGGGTANLKQFIKRQYREPNQSCWCIQFPHLWFSSLTTV